jgi:EmrB/QacA subfamily drug resistance transporter
MNTFSPKLNKIFIIIAMSACYTMIFLDVSGVAVALPKLQQSLALSNNAIQWVMNSYLLFLATLQLLGGKLADNYGRRRIFIVGIILFLIASIVCASAQNIGSIISGRILQGIGASLIMPTIAVLINMSFPEKEFGKAFSTILIVSTFTYAIGPFIGGTLVGLLSWRWIFWINVPLSIICLGLTFLTITNDKPRDKPVALDLKGLITFVIAISALVIALMQSTQHDWSSYWIVTLFIIGILGLLLFIRIELHTPGPLLQIALFRIKTFTAGIVIVSCAYACLTITVFLPLWLHHVFAFSPTWLGWAMLPATLPGMFIQRFAGSWRDKAGPRPPLLWGAGLTIISFYWLACLADLQNYWLLIPAFIAFSLGLTFLIPISITTVITSVKPEQRGMASGATSLRQVMGTVGFALMSAVSASYSFSAGIATIGIFAIIAGVFAFVFIRDSR